MFWFVNCKLFFLWNIAKDEIVRIVFKRNNSLLYNFFLNLLFHIIYNSFLYINIHWVILFMREKEKENVCSHLSLTPTVLDETYCSFCLIYLIFVSTFVRLFVTLSLPKSNKTFLHWITKYVLKILPKLKYLLQFG